MRHHLSIETYAILMAAMMLFLFFYFHSNEYFYGHDTAAHLQYITYLLQHRQLPQPSKGWEFWQPPLYYVVAALWSAVRWIAPYTTLAQTTRLLSLPFYIGFLWFSAKTMSRVMSSRVVYYLALCCIALWPCGVIMATRINNDIPLYFFYAGAFYYLVLWRETSRAAHLGKALLMASLAVATKSTGFIILGLIALNVAYRLARGTLHYKALRNKTLILYSIAALLCVSVNAGRSIYYHATENAPLIVGNAAQYSDNDPAAVHRSLHGMIGFDMNHFLHPPYYNIYSDAGGRQYFWVALLKTSLYDEAQWGHNMLAALINLDYLLLLVYALPIALTLRLVTRAALADLLFYSIAFLFPIAFIAYPRATLPVFMSIMEEFRYIQPAIIPLFLTCDAVITHYRHAELPKMAVLGMALLLFLAGSFLLLDYQVFIHTFR